MRYLITGGAGFIGSNIVAALLGSGAEVRILDNLTTGKMSNIESFLTQITFIEGDIRDATTCAHACADVDYVLHQAALGSVPRSIDDPLTTHNVNLTGTLNMMIAARDAKVKRFVYASSSSVYGDTPTLPKVETMPLSPLSPYAFTKQGAEVYGEQFFKFYGLETIGLRYFNVFGPKQDPDSQYAAVIPKFVSAVREGRSPTIFGDGHQKRDFTYIDNVVNANLGAATRALKTACGRAYNVACHKAVSVNDLYYRIRDLVSVEKPASQTVEPVYAHPRAGDVRESLAAIDLARQHLSYEPTVGFDEGIQKTVSWFLAGSSPVT